MYLELVPDKLKELTYPQLDGDAPFREPRSALEVTRVVPQRTEGGALEGRTSTENTTETSTGDFINLINSDSDRMDSINIYRNIIKKNIEYEYIALDNEGRDKELLDEIVELMTEIVAIDRESIYIGGEKYPYHLVKSKLLKLGTDHIRYVMECMKKNTSKVGNIRSYLLTSLYNASNTIGHYYQAEVNHDLYGNRPS